MSPLQLLRCLSKELSDYHGSYALCGGLAASLFRDKPRMTNDVDIAFCAGSYDDSKNAATAIIKRLGLVPTVGWIAEAEGKLNHQIPLVIGNAPEEVTASSVDFLLPAFPWVEIAVKRAQNHLVELGFGTFPVVTVEDLIVAKLFALSISPNRFSDLDDLQSIFLTDPILDLTYLVTELERHKLRLPEPLIKSTPEALRRSIKRRKR